MVVKKEKQMYNKQTKKKQWKKKKEKYKYKYLSWSTIGGMDTKEILNSMPDKFLILV